MSNKIKCEYSQELFGRQITCEQEAEFSVMTEYVDVRGQIYLHANKYCKSHKDTITSITSTPVKHSIQNIKEEQ